MYTRTGRSSWLCIVFYAELFAGALFASTTKRNPNRERSWFHEYADWHHARAALCIYHRYEAIGKHMMMKSHPG